MGVTDSFKKVLDSQIDDYHAPKRFDVCGVPVYIKPEPSGVSVREWKDVIDRLLPLFDDARWLDGFQKIIISDGAVDGGVGKYMMNGSIYLENDVSMRGISASVIDDSPESTLAHEMVHHAHLTLNDYNGGNKRLNNEMLIKNAVSYYAGTNINESIAEIGAGIIHGHDFPDWVHEHYADHDGPEGVYEIGQALR